MSRNGYASTFKQAGNTIRYTNSTGSTITAGSVVEIADSATDGMIGIAVTDIPDGEEGVLEVTGVHKLPKLTGVVIAAGTTAYWDDDPGGMTSLSTSNNKAGVFWEAAVSGATEVLVNINARV